MTPELVVDLFQGSLYLGVRILAVVILPGLAAGLLISIFQAATQINEQTLSFLPRLVVTIFSLIIAAPWLLSLILNYMQRLFSEIPTLIG